MSGADDAWNIGPLGDCCLCVWREKQKAVTAQLPLPVGPGGRPPARPKPETIRPATLLFKGMGLCRPCFNLGMPDVDTAGIERGLHGGG